VVAAIAVAALGLAGALWFTTHKQKEMAAPSEPKTDSAKVDRAVPGAVGTAADDRLVKLKESYTEALQYEVGHREDVAEGIKRFEELKQQAGGTEYEAKPPRSLSGCNG